jgi:uncharacterized protein (TIGR02246 family)
MKTLSNLLSSFLIAFLLVGCSGEKQTAMNEDIATITAMSKARADAFNEGNAAEIARYFADDAFLMAPGKISQRGKEAVEAYYQSIFDEFETVLESGYEDVVVDGNLAYGRGFAKVSLTPKNGGEKTYATSKYLNILERQNDGTWITTHDIWNGNEE